MGTSRDQGQASPPQSQQQQQAARERGSLHRPNVQQAGEQDWPDQLGQASGQPSQQSRAPGHKGQHAQLEQPAQRASRTDDEDEG